jgi:hypothetical protein
MEKQGLSIWRFGLIILGIMFLIVLALIGVALLFTIDVTNQLLVAVGLSAVFVVYTIYASLRKRQWTVFAIIAIIVGVLILTSSTLAIVPYSTAWTYQTQYSSSILNETASIRPKETLNYSQRLFYSLTLNSSRFQVRISSDSNNLTMLLYATDDYKWEIGQRPEPVMNITMPYGGFGYRWLSFYWVPLGTLIDSGPYQKFDLTGIDFVVVNLTNLDSSTASVSIQLDMFYIGDAQRVTTDYRPLLNAGFASVGMGLVAVAVVVEAYPSLRMRRKSVDTISSASGTRARHNG